MHFFSNNIIGNKQIFYVNFKITSFMKISNFSIISDVETMKFDEFFLKQIARGFSEIIWSWTSHIFWIFLNQLKRNKSRRSLIYAQRIFISYSFEMKKNITVVTVFLLIMKLTGFCKVYYKKENGHYDHIPFN